MGIHSQLSVMKNLVFGRTQLQDQYAQHLAQSIALARSVPVSLSG